MNARIRPEHEPRAGADAPETARHVDFCLVGSGFSGLGMAIRLKQRGVGSFVVLEKGADVGGTWNNNRYPGCACDVPSHLYSFSFEPNPNWSELFAPRAEIHDYLRRCAERYGLEPHLRLNTEVSRAVYDEATATWRVTTSTAEIWTCRHLVLGIGGLSRPERPDIRGLERFQGRVIHSADWDERTDLAGARVAVIGTGASAIQLVPRLAQTAAQLSLFQRTPPWVLPRPNRPMSPRARRLFARVPALQRLYRWWIYWLFELRGLGFTVNPKLMRQVARLGRAHIRRHIADPVLRRAVTPSYLPGCKRILMANDYYPALARANVKLVCDPITHVTERGLVTADGHEHEVDAIVCCTGFRVADILTPLEIVGPRNVSLNRVWAEGNEAYLGTLISGFPNLFMLLGPNTGLGHNSMVFMIESQIEIVLRCVAALERRKADSVEVRSDVQSAFNSALQPRLARSVWASGCSSWYLDQRGKNHTLWPGFTFEFWYRARHVRPDVLSFAVARGKTAGASVAVSETESVST